MTMEREDEDDVEVMQVVAKRGPDDELNRERPMSWEGELSEDEAMSDHHLEILRPSLPQAPPGSPMCVVVEKEAEKRISVEVSTDSSSTVKAGSSGGSSPTSQLSGFVATVSSRSPFPGSPAPSPSERLRSGHPVPYVESPLSNHRSPAQSRHVIGYSGAYSQSPSPVLTRPTSSSSSRSSYSPTQSPLLGRHISSTSHTHSPVLPRHAAGTSSDGSIYSPTSSPLQGRHISAESSVYSPTQSPSQGRHVPPDSASSFSPTQSPAHLRSTVFSRPLVFASSPSPTPLHRSTTVTPEQSGEGTFHQYGLTDHDSRITQSTHHHNHEGRLTASSASVASSASDESNASDFSSPTRRHSADNGSEDGRIAALSDLSQSALGVSGTSSISRQQLLSGPCPICGDRISGFHYGIFSCESCKGFFKRTVQNKKNYVCLRGAKCIVAISTRKKCPACRFDKCLKMGMKLEAIREDRTRGGRSTYQCSYTLSTQSLSDGRGSESGSYNGVHLDGSPVQITKGDYLSHSDSGVHSAEDEPHRIVPLLIQEILAVEHLWHYTDKEMGRLSEQYTVERVPDRDPDFLNNLCNIADHRLFKIVKWCKSLPLFRDIGTDDQIALLINVWCELLLLSCCYRSMSTPSEIRVSLGKSMNLSQAKSLGLGPVIERMLNLTEHLRRLQVDQHEYVCLKVIILLTSDASGLKEPEKVRACQKQVLEALQTYTRTHYPQQPSKFGELLLRIPELERACQVGKESLASKQRAGEVPSFNLLMELLRGDH